MNWYWGLGVHAVLHGEDLVILDRGANDYLILPRAAQSVSLSADRAAAQVEPAVLEMLAGAGLGGTEAAPHRVSKSLPPTPARDLAGAAPCAATRADALRLARATAGLIGGYALRSFADLGRDPEPSGRPADEAQLCRLALSWRDLLPWVPFQGACLYRAASLRAFLGSDAAGVSWVFGVSTWPFAAHCWLQRGDLVLNDSLAQVARYTPILAL